MVIDCMPKFEMTFKDTVIYNRPKELDGIQEHPKNMKSTDFKQDYVVMIRKKLYYAASSVSDEYYLRMYQINNFISVRTSHNVNGRPGTCSVTLKGGERVVCAERPEQDNKAWASYEEMLNGWTSIDNEAYDARYDSQFEGDQKYWRVGKNDWAEDGAEGVDYKNLMKTREAKYGWKFAEKCDWEPMDEIIIFGKSRSRKKGTKGEFEMIPIFFGYLDSIQKTYQAGRGGLQININASDHLKLFQLGKVVNSPSLIPGKFSGGGIDLKYTTDQFGCFIINDPWLDITSGEKSAQEIKEYYVFENVFSGKYPYEIITQLAVDSGIPKKYLTKRIEQIKSVPFLMQINGKNGDLFNGDLKDRLSICQQAAEKLFLEFFADEEGNIVLKIPNYALGANKLPANNMNIKLPENVNEFHSDRIVETENGSSDLVKVIEYTIQTGDTLESIAQKYLKDKSLYKELHHVNYDIIGSDPNKIKVGQKITIYSRDTTNEKANTEALRMINSKEMDNIGGQNDGPKLKIMQGTTLCEKTDHLIPAIPPEDVVSFTLNDSDKEIYNMYEIQAETVLGMFQGTGFETIRRAVPDLPSIVRFGLRPHPGLVNTPLIRSEDEAQAYGMMMINKSMANRFTGTVTIIEDSAIKVGNPIRLLTYDEHPNKINQQYSKYREQTIFYVTGIERSISINGVSHMTLQVRAGRVMGQESIYDICYPVYKMYYNEKIDINLNESLQSYKDHYSQSGNTISHIILPQDTIDKIIKKYYGEISSTMYEDILKGIVSVNSELFGSKNSISPEMINEMLIAGKIINIPNPKAVKTN